jgi:VIT1/CCC1 family predicted Fe2+/Mn2+ transporter
MTTHEITRAMTPEPSRLRARLVGVYYLLTIATGVFILFFHGRIAFIADLLVAVVYLAVTAFLYGWSASGNREKSVRREDL